jgi:hypothetical protein
MAVAGEGIMKAVRMPTEELRYPNREVDVLPSSL